MRPVIADRLYRAARPGYSGGGRMPVGMGEVQRWIESAQSLGITSIICLLADEHLCLYPDADLLGTYRTAGFEVRHIPVTDHTRPPLTPEQQAQRCNTGRLIGGLGGGAMAYAMSRDDGRAWAIPLGALLGSQVGCNAAAGRGPLPW